MVARADHREADGQRPMTPRFVLGVLVLASFLSLVVTILLTLKG
jgi:hypothetical protein